MGSRPKAYSRDQIRYIENQKYHRRDSLPPKFSNGLRNNRNPDNTRANTVPGITKIEYLNIRIKKLDKACENFVSAQMESFFRFIDNLLSNFWESVTSLYRNTCREKLNS